MGFPGVALGFPEAGESAAIRDIQQSTELLPLGDVFRLGPRLPELNLVSCHHMRQRAPCVPFWLTRSPAVPGVGVVARNSVLCPLPQLL